jgi:hypothetical protein
MRFLQLAQAGSQQSVALMMHPKLVSLHEMCPSIFGSLLSLPENNVLDTSAFLAAASTAPSLSLTHISRLFSCADRPALVGSDFLVLDLSAGFCFQLYDI